MRALFQLYLILFLAKWREFMAKCSYCGDTGFIGTGFVEKTISGHRVMYPHTEPCYCRVNFNIGKKYGILSPVSPAHPKDAELVHKTFKADNWLFHGPEDIFLYYVKCYFLTGFMYKNYIILEGGTVVEQFNVPKESTGDWLTTSHLNQYDLVALMFTTSARYTSLKDCVLEVIKNRGRLAKPTWVYAPDGTKLKEAREYSQEVQEHLDTYKKFQLGSTKGLKGYTPRKQALQNKETDMNNSLGGK